MLSKNRLEGRQALKNHGASSMAAPSRGGGDPIAMDHRNPRRYEVEQSVAAIQELVLVVNQMMDTSICLAFKRHITVL